MTEHKYTDDEIIRALECCVTIGGCDNCPFYNNASCGINLRRYARALINRQKAEVKRLEKQNAEMLISETAEFHIPMEIAFRARTAHPIFREIKAEAIKEFAERLKEKIRVMDRIIIYGEDIDNLVKEMTEGK